MPINNQATTGLSIAKGNYLNLPRTDQAVDNVPTWKQVQERELNNPGSNFYANAFNLNQKRQPDELEQAKLQKFIESVQSPVKIVEKNNKLESTKGFVTAAY